MIRQFFLNILEAINDMKRYKASKLK